MDKRLLSGLAAWILLAGCFLVFSEKRVPASQFFVPPAVVSSRGAHDMGPQFPDRIVEQEMLALANHARVGMLLRQGPFDGKRPSVVIAVEVIGAR